MYTEKFCKKLSIPLKILNSKIGENLYIRAWLVKKVNKMLDNEISRILKNYNKKINEKAAIQPN
ncbi:MAG: hypothetical protein FWE04_00760 [Oscillospiraceae bacterium]|nr:hypothetical protein [Oscillospiraceae bacterium]